MPPAVDSSRGLLVGKWVVAMTVSRKAGMGWDCEHLNKPETFWQSRFR